MKIKTIFFIPAALIAAFAITSFTISADTFQNSAQKTIAAPDTADSRKVVINEQYSMRIPKHMSVATGLNSDASLQYQNTEEELYIIVIDEPSKEFVAGFKKSKSWDESLTNAENYRKIQVATLTKGIKTKGKPVVQQTRAGSLPMEIVDFTGKVKGIDFPIAYKLGFLECDGNLYMIMTWTLQEKKSFHNAEMAEMLRSFRSEK